MKIREIQEHDWPQVWQIIEPVFRAGETYPVSPEITEAEARLYWVDTPLKTYVVVVENGEILGTYYLKHNQPGLGAHVSNCGYIVSERARGRGVGSAMCAHSLQTARELGFRAMQYNLVVATNHTALHVWRKHGFQVVGRLPGAFRSKRDGYVDALVMYKELATDSAPDSM